MFLHSKRNFSVQSLVIQGDIFLSIRTLNVNV